MVSVIIPAYNRAELLKRSIFSVLEQTYKNLELIIVDDGSTDNTEEIVKSLNDERINYIRQKNQGACAARNTGIDNAQGEYIAFQDSDDIWHTDKLEKQLAVVERTDADIVFSKMVRIENGKQTGISTYRFSEGFVDKSVCPFTISTQTLFGKAEIFKNNKFDVAIPRWQDFELLLRLHKTYSLYCIDEPLVDYYIQTDSISRNPEKLLSAWKLIQQKNPDFNNRYAASLEFLSLKFLNTANEVADKELRKIFIDAAFALKRSPKVLMKAFLIKTNLYEKYVGNKK